MNNLDYNRRGMIVLSGRVMPTFTVDDSKRIGRDDEEHSALVRDLDPLIDLAVREIERETESLRHRGKLAPFVEGTPIGVLPRRVRQRKTTTAQLHKLRAERYHRRQDEMMAWRKRNKETIASLLERKF